MKGKFKAVFIIPKKAKRTLGDDGWQFESHNRLSLSLKDYLTSVLSLEFLESYLGIDSYVAENIKMSVFYDNDNKIENIYFQLHGKTLSDLEQVFYADNIIREADVFIPEEIET